MNREVSEDGKILTNLFFLIGLSKKIKLKVRPEEGHCRAAWTIKSTKRNHSLEKTFGA